MSGQGTSIAEDIDASGIVGSDAAEVVLTAATSAGLVVTATGPGQYQLTRSYRAGWVVPAAIVGVLFFGLGILLLFLVPKRTEICAVAINEHRRGVTVRLSGVAPAAFVDRVRRDLVAAGSVVGSTSAPPPPAPLAPAVSPPPPSSTPDPPDGREMMMPRPAPTSGAIAPMPSGTVSATPSPPEPETHMTVLRGQVSDHRAGRIVSETADSPAVVIAGRVEPIGAGLVIGRNPSPPAQLAVARAVSIADGELSKTHLAIRWNGQHVEVCDLSSTNGTVVAGVGSERRCEPGTWNAVPVGAHIRAGTQTIGLR